MALEVAKSLLLRAMQVTLKVGRSTLASLELNAPTSEPLLEFFTELFEWYGWVVKCEDDVSNNRHKYNCNFVATAGNTMISAVATN